MEKLDNWRYVPMPMWRIQNHCTNESVEDQYIDVIDWHNAHASDGPVYTEDEEIFLDDWMKENLDPREHTVISLYLFQGIPMTVIGDAYQLSRQRIWQIYRSGLKKISECFEGDPEQFKKFFSMEDKHND